MKNGEQMNFDALVNVEALPEGNHLKKTTVFSNVPHEGAWEVISDESKSIDGGQRTFADHMLCDQSSLLHDND